MKHTATKSVLAMSLVLMLGTANAQVQEPQQPTEQHQEQEKPKFDKKRIFKKAGFGCAIGAGLSILSGKKDKAVLGCAAGATVGGVMSYREQLKEAREVEQAAQAAGMNVNVQTKEVVNKDGSKEQALDALVIKYDPKDMKPVTEKTAKTLDKIATLSAKAKNSLTFKFEGKTNCDVPVDELKNRGAFERHTVMDRCGKGVSQITITPMPEV